MRKEGSFGNENVCELSGSAVRDWKSLSLLLLAGFRGSQCKCASSVSSSKYFLQANALLKYEEEFQESLCWLRNVMALPLCC